MTNKTKLCKYCGGVVEEKPAEDLAIALAGLLIAPTHPWHKSKAQQKAWFKYWERELTKAIKRNVRNRYKLPK